MDLLRQTYVTLFSWQINSSWKRWTCFFFSFFSGYFPRICFKEWTGPQFTKFPATDWTLFRPILQALLFKTIILTLILTVSTSRTPFLTSFLWTVLMENIQYIFVRKSMALNGKWKVIGSEVVLYMEFNEPKTYLVVVVVFWVGYTQ